MGSCQSVSGTEGKSESRQKSKPQLLIKSFTWSRDSHDLFDYENKALTKKNIKSGNGGRIVRRLNEVNFTKDNEQPVNTADQELLQLTIKDGNYWVGPSRDANAKKPSEGKPEGDSDERPNNLWMVVKSFRPTGASRNGCKLGEGDLLKLGRIKFKVKELRGHSAAAQAAADKKASQEKHITKSDEDLSGDESPKKSPKGLDDSRASNAQTCRICLGEGGEAEDPFFSPCRCTGTMRYIHVQCLQKWLKSKLQVKQTPFSTSIHWKTLECELCKTTYKSSYNIEGKKYDIIEVERPDCGYLMLEILSKEKNVTRGIHIIKMDGKTNVRLGRGHDSDIRVSDISVSRCHAIIRLEKGEFYIEDNASKFGTLMHMRKPFALFGDYNNVSLQVGRTVVTLCVKKNWKSLQGCFGGDNVKNPIEMDYEDMFDKVPETHYQHSEAAPIRNSHRAESPEPGHDEDDDEGHNHNDIAPHAPHEGGNDENDDIVDLDNADLSNSEDSQEDQQVAEAPENLAQSQVAQRPADQPNTNVAIIVQNMVVNANPNQQVAQAPAVHDNQVSSQQIIHELAQSQVVEQTN